MNDALLHLASPKGRKSNLAFALCYLPADRRKDALVFYDFCRVVDDIADDATLPPEKKHTLLSRWQDALESGQGLPSTLENLIARRGLDRSLLLEIVRGVMMDVTPQRYATYEDLRGYCWRVACAVGLVSIKIFGCREPGSKDYAEHLGQALQLTNILRDVSEDASLGRIYLPLEDLRRFGVSEESLLARRPEGDFFGLMRFETRRAQELYQAARQALPAADAQALLPAETMRAIYEKILDRMARDGFRVFEKRYRLAAWEKLWLLGKSFLAGKRAQ